MLKLTCMYLYTTCRHYVHISYCSLHICIHILHLHITHRCTPVCTHAQSFLNMHIHPSLTSQPPHKHTFILDHTHTCTITHMLSLSHTFSLTYSLPVSHTHTHIQSHNALSHTFSLTHSLPVTHTHTHTVTESLAVGHSSPTCYAW